MSQTNLAAEFAAELAEVEAALLTAAGELGAPLGELVQAQVRRAFPLVRAALVLTVAGDSAGDPDLRAKRILLASALEMLHVAMHVHRLLLDTTSHFGQNGESAGRQDRTFMGGAILAGDYCFSRAAQMAARTDNAAVVKIFAKTLQVISEGQLRRLFEGDDALPFDEQRELLRSGAAAAAALAGLDDSTTQAARKLSEEIAERQEGRPTIPDEGLPVSSIVRRQTLWNWLASRRHNGHPGD